MLGNAVSGQLVAMLVTATALVHSKRMVIWTRLVSDRVGRLGVDDPDFMIRAVEVSALHAQFGVPDGNLAVRSRSVDAKFYGGRATPCWRTHHLQFPLAVRGYILHQNGERLARVCRPRPDAHADAGERASLCRTGSGTRDKDKADRHERGDSSQCVHPIVDSLSGS